MFSVIRYTDSGYIFGIFKHFWVKSRDLNFELLTIASANIWKPSGLELRHILIQQELIFIEKYRTNIPERTRWFNLKEFKFELQQRMKDNFITEMNTFFNESPKCHLYRYIFDNNKTEKKAIDLYT